MSRDNSETMTMNIPVAIRPAVLRAGLALAVIASVTAFAVRTRVREAVTHAQSALVLTVGQ
jgi:hypothetical protein